MECAVSNIHTHTNSLMHELEPKYQKTNRAHTHSHTHTAGLMISLWPSGQHSVIVAIQRFSEIQLWFIRMQLDSLHHNNTNSDRTKLKIEENPRWNNGNVQVHTLQCEPKVNERKSRVQFSFVLITFWFHRTTTTTISHAHRTHSHTQKYRYWLLPKSSNENKRVDT